MGALTEDFLVVPPDEAPKIDIRTQAETTEGRPDLEVRWADYLVVIEVKVESELHKGNSKATGCSCARAVKGTRGWCC